MTKSENAGWQETAFFADGDKPKKKKQKKYFLLSLAAIVMLAAVAIVVLLIHSQEKIVAIEASYHGDVTAGTVLDKNNSGISVSAMKRNGERISLSSEEWSISTPKTLTPDKEERIVICADTQICYLTVACSDSEAVRIVASYEGETAAGTPITIGSAGLRVTALKKNGETAEITSSCTMQGSPVVLQENRSAKLVLIYTDPASGNDLSDMIEVTCSTRTLRQISVKYEGKAEAGEVLDAANEGIRVIATYNNGDVEPAIGWTVKESVTLMPSQISTVDVQFNGMSQKLMVECSEINEKEYKENCARVRYADLMRVPENYENKMVVAAGTVYRVEAEAGARNRYKLRIKTGRNQYILVLYNATEEEKRPLKDDRISCYGVFLGVDDSTSAEMPMICAKYVVLG